ncbi:Fic family protein [uncultured Fibrobacter sp.]|uniref:Fic/DOC family protein n=1 Tax=uncultured Fibrobacter sp. TaxID=261512 RepID=UPI0025CEB8D6|nr:Fic family protein [uncultured Fibrobacter sp.]
MAKKKFEIDFENYVRNAPPSKREKSSAWSAAIGLQQVDGLTPSKYLFETARRNIEGDITIDDAQKLINSYYKSKVSRANDPDDTEEADKVASRIAKILSERAFSFSPSYLIAIHGKLFQGIYKFAGRLRDYDITKKEWVLDGDTVMYGAAFELRMALDYDFEQEREFNYKGLNMDQIVEHLADFVSRLWQIHAFGEGNTRTTAVFMIKYLRSLGFKVDNKIFADNSWFFRNALVRANYSNVPKGISREPGFLENFFRNMLMGEHHEMKNRYLHVNYRGNAGARSSHDGIAVEKATIQHETAENQSAIAGIEQRLESAKLNAPTKEKLLSIIQGVGNEVFGASKVMELTGCKPTAATSLIKKLLSLEIIEPVAGHGKGKYRVKG